MLTEQELEFIISCLLTVEAFPQMIGEVFPDEDKAHDVELIYDNLDIIYPKLEEMLEALRSPRH